MLQVGQLDGRVDKKPQTYLTWGPYVDQLRDRRGERSRRFLDRLGRILESASGTISPGKLLRKLQKVSEGLKEEGDVRQEVEEGQDGHNPEIEAAVESLFLGVGEHACGRLHDRCVGSGLEPQVRVLLIKRVLRGHAGDVGKGQTPDFSLRENWNNKGLRSRIAAHFLLPPPRDQFGLALAL